DVHRSKRNVARSNSEADTGSSGQNPTSAIYRHSLVETNQTARISLQSSINVKQHCIPKAKNKTVAPIPQRARPDHPSNAAVSPARPALSQTTNSTSAPPVRGYLRLLSISRKGLFAKSSQNARIIF
ncbi:hypothetical protein, partial [Ruegeria marina]|uniref:hypothetical protein n=1 Tax=Ruegeria marina TaxID=639004 RepID=UPI001C40A6B4